VREAAYACHAAGRGEVLFCTDGDNKGGGPRFFCDGTALWRQARCKCHKGKNLSWRTRSCSGTMW
jgi:hypothetical protein